MKLSSNFINFHNELGLVKTIDVFSEAGFEAIDFNADLQEYYTDAHDKEFYEKTRKYAQEKGIVFSQTHAPFASSFLDEERTAIRFSQIIKSMEHSSYLGADMIVVHPCKHIHYKESGNYALMMEYNLDFYKSLIPYAKQYNLKIAIENIGGSITETPEGLLELFDTLNDEVFTICYDVGHANICGQNPADMIRQLGKRIGCTHIHDNDGVSDSHTLPFYGSINWDSVMKAFAEVGYEGNFNYEAGYFLNHVPVDFRHESAKYMASVGKYLIEKYRSYKR